MAVDTDFERRFLAATRGLTPGSAHYLSVAEDVERDPDAQEDGLDIPTTQLIETTHPPDELSKATKPAVLPTSINLFQHPDAHPVVLDLILLQKYGPEWMLWESETLIWRIPQDFHTSGISDLNLHKIQAMKVLHYNDTYWQRWEVFNWCTQPFSSMPPDFEVMQVPSTAQMLVSVDISKRVREDVAWTDEVKEFMVQACRFEGIFCPPEPLDFLSVIPEHGLVDTAEIKRLWPDVRRTGVVPPQMGITAVQLGRTLDAYDFLKSHRQMLQDQLRVISYA